MAWDLPVELAPYQHINARAKIKSGVLKSGELL
jgi:hypothetical protein